MQTETCSLQGTTTELLTNCDTIEDFPLTSTSTGRVLRQLVNLWKTTDIMQVRGNKHRHSVLE